MAKVSEGVGMGVCVSLSGSAVRGLHWAILGGGCSQVPQVSRAPLCGWAVDSEQAV